MEMGQAETGSLDDFLQTGRTGRRNAVPDIRDENAAVSTASLPDSMEKLSCSDTSGVSGTSCTKQAEAMDTTSTASESAASEPPKS